MRAFATGAAPLNLWRPAARSSRLLRPIWIWSTCVAMPSGPASAKPSAASAWTEWQHQADSVTSIPTGATFATNRGAEQGDVLGTIHGALVLGQARDTHLEEFLSKPTEVKGVCSFVPFCLTPSYVPGMLPLPPSAPPGGAPRIATSRAPRACSVLLSGRWSFFARTRRMCTMFSRRSQAPLRWAQHSAPASTSMHERGSRCEPVRACDEMRSAIARQCADDSKLMHHMRIAGCFGLSVAGPVSARPPLTSPVADWAHARHCFPSLHVPPLGVHHGRPLQPRLWRPEPADHDRLRCAH